MRYRRVIRDNNINNIVWFGSYGVNPNGTAKFVGPGKHENFSSGSLGVKDSLTQQLNTIEGELWYAVNFGIPLMDNFTSKSELDTEIMSMILAHPEVQTILKFTSRVQGRHYWCEAEIQSTFGVIILSV